VVGKALNTPGYNAFALARFNANGSLDTSIDTDGKILVSFATNQMDEIFGIALQSDEKVVAFGTSGADFGLARFNWDNGSLDTTYGTNGFVTTDFSGYDYGSGDVLLFGAMGVRSKVRSGVHGISLGPGAELHLTLNDAYFAAPYSRLKQLVAGTRIYVQVDSANFATSYGAIQEVDEFSGGSYNNISSTFWSVEATTMPGLWIGFKWCLRSEHSTGDMCIQHRPARI
jgi:uncharacterized delta-60 repeat protein